MSTSIFIAYPELSMALLLGLALLGLALLTVGGDGLTRGASRLATYLHVNPVVIGLTVVSVATSMPELITCLISALQGNSGLAIGNIVGSNLGNIGLILGIAAVLRPIRIQPRLIFKEMPILIAVTALFILLCWNGISRWEGVLLSVGMCGYLFFVTREARELPPELREEMAAEWESTHDSVLICLLWIVLGSVALAVGSDVLVKSSVEIAERYEVSDFLIGFTLVAIGTSLPELATSIIASIRRQGDLCAGNIVGSNIFNMLLIGGSVAAVSPLSVPVTIFYLEIPAMAALTVLLWVFFTTARRVGRSKGAVLIVLYFVVIGASAWLQLGY